MKKRLILVLPKELKRETSNNGFLCRLSDLVPLSEMAIKLTLSFLTITGTPKKESEFSEENNNH